MTSSMDVTKNTVTPKTNKLIFSSLPPEVIMVKANDKPTRVKNLPFETKKPRGRKNGRTVE